MSNSRLKTSSKSKKTIDNGFINELNELSLSVKDEPESSSMVLRPKFQLKNPNDDNHNNDSDDMSDSTEESEGEIEEFSPTKSKRKVRSKKSNNVVARRGLSKKDAKTISQEILFDILHNTYEGNFNDYVQQQFTERRLTREAATKVAGFIKEDFAELFRRDSETAIEISNVMFDPSSHHFLTLVQNPNTDLDLLSEKYLNEIVSLKKQLRMIEYFRHLKMNLKELYENAPIIFFQEAMKIPV